MFSFAPATCHLNPPPVSHSGPRSSSSESTPYPIQIANISFFFSHHHCKSDDITIVFPDNIWSLNMIIQRKSRGNIFMKNWEQTNLVPCLPLRGCEVRDNSGSSINIWEAHITSPAARQNENKALKAALKPALLKSCLQDCSGMSYVLTDGRGESWSHPVTSHNSGWQWRGFSGITGERKKGKRINVTKSVPWCQKNAT